MYQSIAPQMTSNAPSRSFVPAEVTVERLTDVDQAEVIEFLSRRPIHTVTMLGFIRDNGLVSPLNRGTFYSCRNRNGRIEGVALIGHATLLETTTDRALEAFAEVAQKSNGAHMIMGERERVETFWQHYEEGGLAMRLAASELLFELQCPFAAQEAVQEFRLATLADLELVMPVQAQMAFDESGINPLEKDPQGFRQRCARRIEQGRTWIVLEDGKMLFKADLISETDDVGYLEGIWVNPANRGSNLGLRCMSQLARTLLTTKKSLCLLVNETNSRAQDFYKRAGYKLRGVYDTIFLS